MAEAEGEEDEFRALWSRGLLVEPPLLQPSVPAVAEAGAGKAGMGPLAASFVGRLSDDEVAALAQYAKRSSISHATICSGTDVTLHCHAALADAVAARTGARLRFEHQFACEIKPEKQRFLKAMHPSMQLLFEDSATLDSATSMDVITGKAQDVPSVRGIVAGFPCTDVSRLNKHSKSSSNKSCAARKSQRTGKVFDDIIRHMKVHHHDSEWCVLENVLALASGPREKGSPSGPSNLAVCVYRLQMECDFAVAVFSLDPSMFGQLTSRQRVYLLCVKNVILEAAGLTKSGFGDMAALIMGKLVGQPRVPLDSVLFPEGDEVVEEHLRAVTAKTSAAAPATVSNKKLKTIQWGIKHSTAFDSSGSSWWAPSTYRSAATLERFAGLNELSTRQIDLLEAHRVKLPEPEPSTLDLNPSIGYSAAGLSIDRVSCLSSTSAVYLAHRGRMAVGIEHLRFVGFFAETATLRQFGGSLLKDLAGNAFDGASYLAACTTLFTVLAKCYSLQVAGRPSLPKCEGAADLFARVWPDSDAE
jgi:site-specific DNA-cytosine methylase